MIYLILQNPGHNRVYYQAAEKLALAELKLAAKRLSVHVDSIETKFIEGVRYLSFKTEDSISEDDLGIISRLSFVFAIYVLEEMNGKSMLLPLKKSEYEYVDGKINTILKYQGKTNELFTKMMVNVALLSSNFEYNNNINLLDPVAGKGTTLFESAVYAFNSFGVEIDSKAVQETTLFFKKYLQQERYKYEYKKRQIAGEKKNQAIYIDGFEYARSKEDFKSKELTKSFGVVQGDTKIASKYFKKDFFHLIVGDLPYGIQHGNKGRKFVGTITRNPAELLTDCLPEWFKVLKKGGTIVLAWNSFVVSKHKLSAIFAESGFKVQTEELFNEFEHMVDKSIKRDIIVAKKI